MLFDCKDDYVIGGLLARKFIGSVALEKSFYSLSYSVFIMYSGKLFFS